MVALRVRMEQRYADWQADLPRPSGWPAFFANCPRADFAAIPEVLQIADDDEAVWPGRRGNLLPGAPEGAHICRAFEGIQPTGVRIVVLGQDPYRSVTEATGRAFEDGSWSGERTEDLGGSIKSLMLAALATRDGHADLFRPRIWDEIRRQIKDGELVLPALNGYFNALARQGVLFVNVAWTRTGDEDIAAHRSLWKPVLEHMLRKLAKDDQPVAFLLLGDDAREAFCAADPVCNRCAIIDNAHPRSAQFLERVNPLERVNIALRELDHAPIRWWPSPSAGSRMTGSI